MAVIKLKPVLGEKLFICPTKPPESTENTVLVKEDASLVNSWGL